MEFGVFMIIHFCSTVIPTVVIIIKKIHRIKFQHHICFRQWHISLSLQRHKILSGF